MPRIYLDNAATSWPKAPSVAPAVAEFLTSRAGLPGRGDHRSAIEVGALLDRLRLRLGAMTGCDPDRVILNSGATEGLNTVVGGVLAAAARASRPIRIVTTAIEHNSIRRTLAGWQRLLGAEVEITRVACDRRGFVSPEAMAEAARQSGADAICMTAASNVLGTIQPVAEVGRLLGERSPDTLLIVDAAQTAGLIEHHMERDGIDALAFSGHKAMLGPPATGALCLSERLAHRLVPVRFGGTGADSETLDMPGALPARLEPGTLNTAGFAGLLAALDEPAVPLTCSEVSASHHGHRSSQLTLPEVAAACLAHERSLITTLLRATARLPVRYLGIEDPAGADLADPKAPRTGVISFTADGWAPSDLAAALDASFNIAVRAGLHCAPDVHDTFGTTPAGGAVRVSVGPHTTEAEIQSLVEALGELLQDQSPPAPRRNAAAR